MYKRAAICLMLGAVALAGPLIADALAQDSDFSLGMVIKSTTNPYYNATLAGAQMAAKELGGTVENFGPTQSRRGCARDEARSAARSQSHHF
jgi:ABC-type sugar transport system substrate-binding protein